MIGIDVKIETLRQLFEDNLWTTTTYSSLGRAFINKRDDKDIPEIYLADGTNYEEVLTDDRIDAHSFFVVRSELEPLGVSFVDFTADVDIYFSVNLKKTYPAVTERAVEYMHRDVISIINGSEFQGSRVITGLDAFSEFGFVKETDHMQPLYLLKVETSIEYQLNENLNC